MLPGHLTKHPNVCSSPLITKQPDSPVVAAQPDEPIVLLCFWSELCGADFSVSVAANLEIAPCRPKLMESQFGGSKALNNSNAYSHIILCVWIYCLTFILSSPLPLLPLLTLIMSLSAARYMWEIYDYKVFCLFSKKQCSSKHFLFLLLVSVMELLQFLLLQKYAFVHLSILSDWKEGVFWRL